MSGKAIPKKPPAPAKDTDPSAGRAINKGDDRLLPDDDFVAAAERFGMGLFVAREERLCHANTLLAEALGYATPEALRGQSLAELVHPDDRELLRNAPEGEPFAGGLPLRLRRAGGKSIWAVIGLGRSVYRGRPAIIGYVILCAALKTMYDTLKRYETILNNADLHLSELDLNGRMTFINDAGCRMWGQPREALIGDGYKAQFQSDKFAEAAAAFRKLYHTGEPVRHLEYRYTRPDGEEMVVEDAISLVRDADGEISGFVMAVKDITDRKAAEKKINEQRAPGGHLRLGPGCHRHGGSAAARDRSQPLHRADLRIFDSQRRGRQIRPISASLRSGLPGNFAADAQRQDCLPRTPHRV